MVSNKIKDPQEIITLYILPAIRRDLAKALKNRGIGQKRISELLCVTEPAVSQYINSKRAVDTCFTHRMSKELAHSAERLNKGASMLTETHRLVQMAMLERVTCAKCKEHLGVPDDCRICVEDHFGQFKAPQQPSLPISQR